MSSATVLRLRDRVLDLGPRPLLMGIVNATPDSFSDAGDHPTLDARVERAAALLEAGADLLDVGGESARGDRPATAAAEEIERVVPLIVRLTASWARSCPSTRTSRRWPRRRSPPARCSSTTCRGCATRAMADVCARTGAGLVLMHTRVAPKGTLLEPGPLRRRGGRRRRLPARADRHRDRARRRARAARCSIPDPTSRRLPRRRWRCCARSASCTRSGARCCSPSPTRTSSGRSPAAGRASGSPARWRRVAHGVDAGAHVLRVHDVAAVTDFLRVRAALRGEVELAAEAGLTPDRFPPEDHSLG